MGRLRPLAGVIVIVIAAAGPACVGDDPNSQGASTPPDGGSSGGSSEGGAPSAPKIITFAATPAKLPYGGGDVKLSLALDGATSASIDNGVGDVLGKPTIDTKVTKTTTFTLTASSAGGSVTATAKVEVDETITVQGKVVSQGQPLVNVPVVVAGLPSTNSTTTGTFTISGVKPPYDIAVGTGNPVAVTVYKGLTRVDPTIVAFGDSGPLPATRRELDFVNGTVTGGSTPYSTPPLVTVSGPNRVAGIATASAGGLYTLDDQAIAGAVTWRGPASVVATFHASTVLSGQGWYGKLENVNLADMANIGSKNIAMNMVDMVTVNCAATGPATFTDAARTSLDAGVRFTPVGGGYTRNVSNTALPRNGTASLHSVAGATFYLEGIYNKLQSSEDQSFARKSVAGGTANISVVLPDVPQATAPAIDATNVGASTMFTFGTMQGGVQRITVVSNAAPTVTVFTKDASTMLPDLTPFGATLPKNQLYTWRVHGYAPLTSLDDPALAEVIDTPDDVLPPLGDVRMTASKPRSFTTAP